MSRQQRIVDANHGPDATCQRSACAERKPHKAGRHLDQRDELYDGPGTLLKVLPVAVRESARKIVREAPALMPEVVDLGEHIELLRRQVAAANVDKDRKVREAMARSADCQAHGDEIKRAGELLAFSDEAARRADAGRVTLLGLLHAVDDLVRAHGAGDLRGDLTVAELVARLGDAAKKTHAAHDRAWKR